MKTVYCIVCRKEFSYKGIHTHAQRAHLGLNDKFSNGFNGKYHTDSFKEKLNIATDAKFGRRQYNVFKCKVCEIDFTWFGRPTRTDHRKTCSSICANQHKKSQESKDKVRASLQLWLTNNKPNYLPLYRFCTYCNEEFDKKVVRSKFCSLICKRKHREDKRNQLDIPEARKYKLACAFKFSIKDYPNEFDFSLLKEYGMYSAKNRGNNLNGVSRDHKVSINYGFKHNIDPNIIKHPANCELVLHRANSSKHINCSISVEELKKKIEIWDQKYKSA